MNLVTYAMSETSLELEVPLALLSRILAQSCVTLYLNIICREGLRMIVLVSLMVMLRELLYGEDIFLS